MSFEHESLFQTEEADDGSALPSDERRASRFTLVDRVGVINAKLPRLQDTYRPLQSITQLRIPAPERGGHDVFFNGKVTNRSNSFADHRATIDYILRLYGEVTRRTEDKLWVGAEDVSGSDGGYRLSGAPVFVKFSELLDTLTFQRWVQSTFHRKNNRFRLGGRPIVLSEQKVHVYGIDRHLWQPLMLEATPRSLYLFLPEGTCGNIVHRLVTNVQRYLDPSVTAWIGDQAFSNIVDSSLAPAA